VVARLELLGALRLVLGGREVILPSSRKARLLLAMLALDRRVHGRSELAGRLWPDVREDSARVSLRTALVQLRAALGPEADVIVRAGRHGGVALAPQVDTDLGDVERLLADREPEAALSRCSRELLAGFDDDWIHQRRDELRDRLAAALGAAAAEAEASGDMQAAIRLTRRQTELDPLAEAAHRDLIRRLAAVDDRGAALAAYHRLRERLADQLGIAPSGATRRLVNDIGSDRDRPAAPAGSVRERLDADARAVVGRVPERAELLRLLDDTGPLVCFVYGIAGTGKSALLRAFSADAAARGAVVLQLDGETIEPSKAGFLAGVSRALGTSVADPIAGAHAIGAVGERVVVVVDGYERLRPLDDWFRESWLRSLPDHVRLAIAGRDPPAAAWSAQYGPLLARFGLDSLCPSDAMELLRRLGMPAARAVEVNRVLRGHPLALQLVASTPARIRGAGDSMLRFATDELTRLFLNGLDRETREALEATSILRRVTRSLVTATLPESPPSDVLARLRRLPFVWSSSDGLIVFHVIRSVIAAQLSAEDPDRYRSLRAAACRQVRDELRRAPRAELGRYGADLLYLSQSPGVRDTFFPNTAPFYDRVNARTEDVPAIEAISRRHEPATAHRLLREWLKGAPDSFTVARAQDGSVAGYSAVCQADALPGDLRDHDPVAAAWCSHRNAHRLPRGSVELYVRHLLTAEDGEAPAPAQAALLQDLMRRSLELRPRLRRIYTCARNPADAAPRLGPLGFRALDAAHPMPDVAPYHCYVLELGAESADGWLATLTGRDELPAATLPGG
jgi:DNA-binding SARP family transcriptional activator